MRGKSGCRIFSVIRISFRPTLSVSPLPHGTQMGSGVRTLGWLRVRAPVLSNQAPPQSCSESGKVQERPVLKFVVV